MQTENVTLMDWINEHWGWLATLLLIGYRLLADHFKIKELEDDMNKLEVKLDQQSDKQNQMIEGIATIKGQLEMIIQAVKSNTDNIRQNP